MATRGEFDVLIAREIDRFARSLAKQLLVEEELRRAGVVIEYVLGEYPDTPEGNLNKNTKAAIAEYERLKIRERMVRGRRRSARNGSILVHGKPPFGYHVVDQDGKRALAIDEGDAATVKMLFDWYVDDLVSARQIAVRLTELGIPTPQHAPHGKWQPRSVGLLLENETYAGTWHYSKGKHMANDPESWIAVDVPAIVSRAQWDKAQALRAQGRARSPRRLKYKYLLRRHAFCASCGTPLICNNKRHRGKLYKYYRCPVACGQARQERTLTCDTSKHHRADKLDAMVWKRIKAWLLNPRQLEAELRSQKEDRDQENAPLRRRLGVLEDLIAQHEGKLAKLLELYLDNVFDHEMLTTRRAELEKALAGLKGERDNLVATLEAATLSDDQIADLIAFAWEVRGALEDQEPTFAQKRKVVRMLDVSVRMSIEDGDQVADLFCKLLGKAERWSQSTGHISTTI